MGHLRCKFKSHAERVCVWMRHWSKRWEKEEERREGWMFQTIVPVISSECHSTSLWICVLFSTPFRELSALSLVFSLSIHCAPRGSRERERKEKREKHFHTSRAFAICLKRTILIYFVLSSHLVPIRDTFNHKSLIKWNGAPGEQATVREVTSGERDALHCILCECECEWVCVKVNQIMAILSILLFTFCILYLINWMNSSIVCERSKAGNKF